MTDVAVADLRDRPGFADTVADRVWRAFWRDGGHPLEALRLLVRESLGPGPVPTTFVAHAGDRFVGTASLIACDLDCRPQCRPWVAAVWVEPGERRRGIGAALVGRAAAAAFAAGAERVHLLAGPGPRGYYVRLGWSVVEEDVPRPGMAVLARGADTAPGPVP